MAKSDWLDKEIVKILSPDPKDPNGLLRRDHTLHGGVLLGLDGHLIELQARAVEFHGEPASWTSAVHITGMARGAIREALSRISGAFAKFGIPGPLVDITINLAPADLPKEGTWLDLPLAVIMLQAAGILPDLPETIEAEYVLAGEVGLHGEIRRVPGVLSLAYIAKPGQKLIVPRGNAKEAALLLARPGYSESRVFAVDTIEDAIKFFAGKAKLDNALKEKLVFRNIVPDATDFSTIRGQDKGKRAAVIAAAGGHNLLLVGPPGEGKSLIASAIPGILPPLAREEQVDLTRIYSAYGELTEDGTAVSNRPFRSVHHTASKQSVIGGGSQIPRPGEVTLSHLGVLFLDELAEFSRATLEALRQPIETGEINVSRVGATIKFPCRFTLVAAMNPCPCGFFGSDRCRCNPGEVKKYLSKVSGPIVDRIDLQVDIERLTTEERFSTSTGPSTGQLARIVRRCRKRQHDRFAGTGIVHNAAIPGGRVRDYCTFSDAAFDRFRQIIDEQRVSTRSMDRLAKVAQTICDLEVSEKIEPVHVDEAAVFVVGGILRTIG